MATPGRLLDVEDLSLQRGGRRVLDGVTAWFGAGEVTAIVGPSGAGKTSLLRCLNRLEEPASGRVLLEGRDVRTVYPPELRRRIGMIFQVPTLFPGGVEANLTYGIAHPGPDALADALERAGLTSDFLGRGDGLSLGQAQRVCIARALLRRPKVLLMDEPTSSLDRSARSRIERLIDRLADDGLALVVVTHDLAQARRVATRAYLLVDGAIRLEGTPARIARRWNAETTA